MKIIKNRAFTLAELMVIIAILTVLFAAFAPVFTVRYNNASSDYVWSYVQDDKQNDAYSDVLEKSLPSESFIGIEPSRSSEISSSDFYAPYSKLVIRATNSLPSGKTQAQIEFRTGNKAGDLKASLFAGKNNMLLGGPNRNIQNYATQNTSFGAGALESLVSGTYNTAVGYNSLNKVTSGANNTAVGYNAGSAITSHNANTYVGYNSGNDTTGNYNTAVGDSSFSSSAGTNNTAIGTYAGTKISGANNTILGAWDNDVSSGSHNGSYNTAAGYNALAKMGGSYNTAIGYNACSAVTGSHKTCIGAESGSNSSGLRDSKIYSDSEERIFIGSRPAGVFSDGGALLEVHNVSGTHNAFQNNSQTLGNSSVVVNGNLVIRGQSFMLASSTKYGNSYPALVSYSLINPRQSTRARIIAAYDGNYRSTKLIGKKGKRHAKYGGHKACICTTGQSTTTMKSYDWSTISGTGYNNATDGMRYGGSYTDKSTNETVSLGTSDHNSRDVVLNEAHGFNDSANTSGCCPYLVSDARLKDIGTPFTAGIEQLKKLNIYNYSFKADSSKAPQVGVIAQNLKQVFPNAVFKDDNGYYKIRWDEIFYSAINAVKELNSRIEALADRVANDRARISKLKKDNAQLEKQLDNLSAELTKLEKD